MSDCGRSDSEPSSSGRPCSSNVLMYLLNSVSMSLMNTGSRCSMHHTGSWLRIARVARVRRVALALLDRQAVLDLVALGVIEADAEHLGVGELVDVLVQPAEDRVDVERRR